MKRRFGTVIAMVLCFILTVVSVYADDGKDQNPDYVTDYYMIVQSTQGGVDIYDEADTQSVKLNDSKIPNGTAIHVLGEKNGADNKKWAYTQYHGMNGYVPMDDLDPASREEAANEEYRTFGGKDVDFEVKVHGNDGNVSVYNGPGEKFDQVSGTEGIADGTTVLIFQYGQGEDGTNWGKTDTDGVTQGWRNLDRDTDYVNEKESADAPKATGTSGNVPIAAVTPTPEAPKKKGNYISIFAGVVAAVVVAGGVGVFAAVKTGAFLSPSKKVLLAGAKTVSDMGSLGETLKDCVSLYSDEYTLKMDLSMNEGDISMEGRSSNEQKQIKGNLNISGAPSIDFLADIGADSVQVEVPTISERLFTYDYRNEKSGYLLEMVDQDTLDAVDATLKAAYDNQNSDEFRKKMLKVYADEYNTLEFSKVDAKDFTIDGTERSCKGYQTVVTKENVNHVIDGLETLYGEDYQELMDALDLTAADFVASMREAVEEFDDSTTLVFYLYKGQYAAIDIIPENDVSFEVQFLGGDTRMQNMILLADDEKVVEVQGSNEGSVETITMIAEENDTVKFTYDSDSGDITMEAKYDEESYNFAGNLAVDKNSMVITIDDLGSASEDVSGSITWKKGAKFEEVSGDTFDLGNATEEEWQDLLHEIFAAMLGGF